MRSLAAALLGVLALTAAASAQPAPSFVGTWGVEGPDACRSGVGTDDLKARFSARQFDYYAASCRVLSSRRLSKSGQTAHRLKLRCDGEEGAKSEKEVILALLEPSGARPELLLHIDAADWSMISYQRCPD